MLSSDSEFMQAALREAGKGRGRTSPNPCVGAVVVRDNKVVGRGYHRRAGTPHAEVHALRAAGSESRGATLYVTLEPCNHTGRTPPCTAAILQAGIARVVVGMRDPNPQVTGGGCMTLAGHGIEVSSGILQEECINLNLPFIKHCTTGLPWVIMKAAMSLDGRIAAGLGRQTAITNEMSLQAVHRMRDRVDAILIGIETALIDDPSLTTRLSGRRQGRDPLRIVLDSQLRLPPAARLVNRDSKASAWIFCNREADRGKQKALEDAGAVVKRIAGGKDGHLDLRAVLREIGNSGMNSLLVEGGGRVHGSFLQAGLVDQAFLFMAPFFMGETGVPVVRFPAGESSGSRREMTVKRTRRFGDNIMVEGRFDD